MKVIDRLKGHRAKAGRAATLLGVTLAMVAATLLFGFQSLPARAQSAPASTDACVGAPLTECLARIHKEFDWVSDPATRISSNEAVDVNGKPLTKGDRHLDIMGKFRTGENPRYRSISLVYGPDHVVHQMEVQLSAAPDMAKTQEQYDRTGLAQAVLLTIGSSCDTAADPLSLYRFFENVVKPKLKPMPRNVQIDMNGASDLSGSYMHDVALCGRKLSYRMVVGNDTELVSLDNPHGLMASATISIHD